MTRKIALFASGSGSNVENIIRYFASKPTVEFPVIISNKPDAYVHERAKKLGIQSITFTKNEFSEGKPVVEYLQKHGVDFIVLAGFLLKISPGILEAYPHKIINIHPALLPKYGGKGMYGRRVHEAVVNARESISGITIHYVNEHYDKGNIIFQATCQIEPSDTPEMVAEKVHALEYEHFPKVIESVFF